MPAARAEAIKRVIITAVVAVLVAALLAVPALLINAYEASLESGVQLVPFAWDLRSILGYLPIGAAGIIGTWLFTKGRTVLASPSPIRHWAKLLLLLVWTFLAAVAAMFAVILTSDDFIFPTTQPTASYPSLSGKRTAHLIYDCFFGCTFSYAIEERGEWSMKRVPVVGTLSNLFPSPDGTTVPPPKRESPLPEVEWIDETKFRFKGGDEAFSALTDREFPE